MPGRRDPGRRDPRFSGRRLHVTPGPWSTAHGHCCSSLVTSDRAFFRGGLSPSISAPSAHSSHQETLLLSKCRGSVCSHTSDFIASLHTQMPVGTPPSSPWHVFCMRISDNVRSSLCLCSDQRRLSCDPTSQTLFNICVLPGDSVRKLHLLHSVRKLHCSNMVL